MALYHKHRPQDFNSVIGQEHITTTITNQVTLDRVAHAYLFSGPRGVGKTTLARILAKALNCENRKLNTAEPCNTCISCQEISESRSIDVIEIDAASHTGVDNVRENIIENAQFKPTKSKHKVFIIDEVHMLSTSAFNALLKTLEEPPKHVTFILATTELHKLPATIISRCQRFDFKKIGFDTMKKHLESVAKAEGLKIDKDVIERIINKSDGCARDAISLLDQIMATGEKHITTETASMVLPNTNHEYLIEFLQATTEKDSTKALELIAQFSLNGVNFFQFGNDLIELLHLMLLLKNDVKNESEGIDLSPDAKKTVKQLSDTITMTEIIYLIDLILKRTGQIKTSPLPQLPLEMFVIEWCTVSQNNTNIQKQTNNTNDKIEIKQEEKKTILKSEDIVARWSEFLGEVDKKHPSITSILKTTGTPELHGNLVQIAVAYDFHRDKIMETACKNNLETLLSQIMQAPLRLVAITDENAIKKNTNELQELAVNFGGAIAT